GVTYTHSRFDNFPNAIVYRPFVASDTGASAQLVTLNGTPTYVGNFTNAAYDATGNALPKTPLWTMNLASSYAIPLSDGGRIVLAGDVFFSSNYWFNANNSYGTGDYSIVNLSAGWELPDGHLKLTAYVTNVGDTDLITYFNESASGTFAAWNRPRMFGVTLQYKL
ncbi:MAG TPA: TonB-dependent receptor, partial [Rhizomicrobium sp.]|nr:TonB-dependent receptor [Rhizomicrobium sp.]